MKVKELLTDESKWLQHRYAINADGKDVNACSNAAVKWCLVGAMIKCYPNCDTVYSLVLDKIKEKGTKYYTLSKWNDAFKRTFEDVKQVIAELDI